jgi:hypothetical protein
MTQALRMNVSTIQNMRFNLSVLLILVVLTAGCDRSREPITNVSKLQGLWINSPLYDRSAPVFDWSRFLSFERDSVSFSTYYRYSPYTINNDTLRFYVRRYGELQDSLPKIFRVIRHTSDSLWLIGRNGFTPGSSDTLRFYHVRNDVNPGLTLQRVVLRTSCVGCVDPPLMRFEIDSNGLLYYTRCFQGRDSCAAFISSDAQHLFRELELRLRLADIDNPRERFPSIHGPEYFLRVYHDGRQKDLYAQDFDGVLGSAIALLMDIPQRVPLSSLKESRTFEADTLWPFQKGFPQ